MGWVVFTHLAAAQDQGAPSAFAPPQREAVKGKEYSLGENGSTKLSVVIARQPDVEHPDWERVTCEFVGVSASGVRSVFDFKSTNLGLASEDMLHADNFMQNGRKQLFLAIVANFTWGMILDFDGERIRIIYETAGYGARQLRLSLRRAGDGQAMIQEEFPLSDPRNYKKACPPGVIYVNDRQMYARLVRWRNGDWSPVKFRQIDKTGEAIPR